LPSKGASTALLEGVFLGGDLKLVDSGWLIVDGGAGAAEDVRTRMEDRRGRREGGRMEVVNELES
jgi:hypothetical protein